MIFWVSFVGLALRFLVVSIVEEVLRDTIFEGFVKSYKGVSKVTIIRRGGNRFSWFLEVVVYVVGFRT